MPNPSDTTFIIASTMNTPEITRFRISRARRSARGMYGRSVSMVTQLRQMSMFMTIWKLWCETIAEHRMRRGCRGWRQRHDTPVEAPAVSAICCTRIRATRVSSRVCSRLVECDELWASSNICSSLLFGAFRVCLKVTLGFTRGEDLCNASPI